MYNNFDWLTRLFCSFPNHDTTLTVILKKHSLHRQEHEHGSKKTLINYHLLVYFFCLSIFERDIRLSFSVLKC